MREGSEEKIKKIKMIVFDVDGVMTDGRIIFNSDGTETKFFDVRDGFGIRLAHRAGLKTGLITGRNSEVTIRRARELEIEDVYQDAYVKTDVFDEILQKHGLKAEEVCYVGDDLVDLPLMRKVGFSIAVTGTVEEVTAEADYVTRAYPGRGAVREVVELILKTQGTWDEAVKRYY